VPWATPKVFWLTKNWSPVNYLLKSKPSPQACLTSLTIMQPHFWTNRLDPNWLSSLRNLNLLVVNPCYSISRSLNVHFPFWHGADEIDTVWSTLQREKIYVSEIQTNRVTSRFLDYLRHFDHLVALSICSSGGTGNEFDAQHMGVLLGILEQHSLRRLRIEPFNWARWSQCSNHASINNFKQLQGIVLHSGWLWGWDSIDSFWWASTIDDVVAIAYLVSRIEAPVTLMLEGELVLYNKFLTFCRNSSSALVRDLCERISYRAHKGASGDWEEFCLWIIYMVRTQVHC